MSNRNTYKTVEFRHPFLLAGGAYLHPAGIYEVQTVDEQLKGLSFLAYRHVSTTITLRHMNPRTSVRHTIEVGVGDLEDALSCDKQLQSAAD